MSFFYLHKLYSKSIHDFLLLVDWVVDSWRDLKKLPSEKKARVGEILIGSKSLKHEYIHECWKIHHAGVNLWGTLTWLLLSLGCKHVLISIDNSCDNDFEDYCLEDNESYFIEDYGENEDYRSYSEKCKYADSYAFNNYFENDDASRYVFSTYSSCYAYNSEENDYALDEDSEETLGEYSFSSSHYDSNSKYENGSFSFVYFFWGGGSWYFTKKLRQIWINMFFLIKVLCIGLIMTWILW